MFLVETMNLAVLGVWGKEEKNNTVLLGIRLLN